MTCQKVFYETRKKRTALRYEKDMLLLDLHRLLCSHNETFRTHFFENFGRLPWFWLVSTVMLHRYTVFQTRPFSIWSRNLYKWWQPHLNVGSQIFVSINFGESLHTHGINSRDGLFSNKWNSYHILLLRLRHQSRAIHPSLLVSPKGRVTLLLPANACS